MNSFWQGLLHHVIVPLAIPIAIIIAALAARAGRVITFRTRQHGFPPIVIRADSDSRSRGFAAELSAYLIGEKLGSAIVIPPGGPGQRAYPIESFANPGWFAALVRIVLAAERTFDVYVRYSLGMTNSVPSYSAIVRVTKAPRDGVLAADLIIRDTRDQLVHDVACLVIHSVRQEGTVVRCTPRWERWNVDSRAYSSYLSALKLERQGSLQRPQALANYDKAIHYDPGNFVITTRKAALLEVMGKPREAAEVYSSCQELWPEAIEVTYRLAAAYSNSEDYERASEALNETNRKLRLSRLWRALIRTWLHAPHNAGERRYWRSWLRHRPVIFGMSRRLVFRHATKIAQLARDFAKAADDGKDAKEISALLLKVSGRTTRGKGRADTRLFHPDHARRLHRHVPHEHDWHLEDEASEDFNMRPAALVRPRRRIGWLAHYNAAIFFSLALKLPDNMVPLGYEPKDWQVDCARAAIRELAYAKRDPRNELEPDWYRKDPGLSALGQYMVKNGKRWAAFVGIRVSG
jgi:tetratricopeptide (TPR) repeat protein